MYVILHATLSSSQGFMNLTFIPSTFSSVRLFVESTYIVNNFHDGHALIYSGWCETWIFNYLYMTFII